MPLRGRPLLHHPLAALVAVTSEVAIAIAAGAEAPPLLRRAPVPLRVVRDVVAGRGPLAGIVAGLEAAHEALVIVVAGDQFELAPRLLGGLLRHAAASDASAVALRDGEAVRPLPCVLRREPALTLARDRLASGSASVRSFLEALGTDAIPEATWARWDPAGAWRQDIDRPADVPAG